MTVRREIHEQNRLSWNEATRAHNSHKRDQARFLREGGSTLYPEEIELLGDLRGQELLHLCCNSGQDTLSIAARLGSRVTGVDISDDAIAFARALSDGSGIPGTFERADVYDWLASAAQAGRYQVVFLSYGAICWLSDLSAFAQGVRAALLPGGRLILMEFHPLLGLFDEQWSRFKYPYQTNADPFPIEDPGVGDYVADAQGLLSPSGHDSGIEGFRNRHPCFSFNHGLGAIVTAVVSAGLRMESFREYPYSNGFRFGPMRALDERRATVPAGHPDLPLMFSLVARR